MKLRGNIQLPIFKSNDQGIICFVVGADVRRWFLRRLRVLSALRGEEFGGRRLEVGNKITTKDTKGRQRPPWSFRVQC